MTSRDQGLFSNDQGRQRRESLGTRLARIDTWRKWRLDLNNNTVVAPVEKRVTEFCLLRQENIKDFVI